MFETGGCKAKLAKKIFNEAIGSFTKNTPGSEPGSTSSESSRTTSSSDNDVIEYAFTKKSMKGVVSLVEYADRKGISEVRNAFKKFWNKKKVSIIKKIKKELLQIDIKMLIFKKKKLNKNSNIGNKIKISVITFCIFLKYSWFYNSFCIQSCLEIIYLLFTNFNKLNI